MAKNHEKYLEDKVRLTDGSHSKAIECTKISNQFRCLACRTGPEIQITGFDNLVTHCAGKKHQTNLGRIQELTWFKKKTGEEHKQATKNQNGSNSTLDLNSNKESINFGAAVAAKKIVVNFKIPDKIEEKVAKFDRHLRIIEIKIKAEYDKYYRDLNDHPQKQNVWNGFWSKRVEELKKEGKVDPNTYDYMPEFMEYFEKQVELFEKNDIENERKNLLKQFGITEKDIADHSSGNKDKLERMRPRSPPKETSSNPKSQHQSKPHDYPRPSCSSTNGRSAAIIKGNSRHSPKSPDYLDNSRRSPKSPDHLENKRKRRSSDAEFEFRQTKSSDSGPSTSKSSQNSKSKSNQTIFKKARKISVEDETSSELEIVENIDNEKVMEVSFHSVFRELVGLEPEVGPILAPKILDLLLKSLQFNKIDSATCDKIMMNPENTGLIEAVREKLMVQLEMKLVEGPKRVSAVHNAVANIQKLLKRITDNDADNDERKKADIMNKMIKMLKESKLTHNDLQTLIKAISEHVENTEEPEQRESVGIEEGEIVTIDDDETSDNKNAQKIEKIVLSDDDEDETPDNSQNNNNASEDIKDSDLKLLLENFENLDDAAQQNLIKFLEDLEKNDVERIKKLRETISEA